MNNRKDEEKTPLLHPMDIESELESESESKNDIHYPIIYKTMIVLSYGNLIALVPYGYSCAIYIVEGGTAAFQSLGLILQSLPKNFGDIPLDLIIGSANPNVKILGITGGGAEIAAGALQVDLPSEIAKKVDRLTYETFHPKGGRLNKIFSWFRYNFSSPQHFLKMLYRACSYFFFGVGSIAGTYVAIDKVKPITLILFGNSAGTVMLIFLSGSVFIVGYVVAYGPKCKSGTEYWITKSNSDHGNFLVKTQVGSECLVIISMRTFFSTFSFNHLAKALELNSGASTLLGASGGFAYAMTVLVPSTHRNYHEDVESDHPITPDEREEAYNETYGRMSVSEMVIKESSRGFLIGWAEGTLVFYLISFELGLPLIVGLVGAGIRYYIFREANLYRELNAIAASKRIESDAKNPTSLAKYGTFANPHTNQPSRKAVITADAISITQQTGRGFTNIDTFVDNPLLNDNLPLRLRIVLGVYSAIIAGYNRHWTFRRDIANTLSKTSWFSESKNSSSDNKAPESSWRDWVPCLRNKQMR